MLYIEKGFKGAALRWGVWTLQGSTGALTVDGPVFMAIRTLALNLFLQRAFLPVKLQLLAPAAEALRPPFPGSTHISACLEAA